MAVDLENLTGAQVKVVVEAIRSSFDEEQLTMLLATDLDRDIDDLAEPGTWEFRVFRVVRASQMQGFGQRLIEAIEAERPDAPRIKGLRTTLGLVAPSQPAGAAAATGPLEKIVRDRSTMRDFGRWLDLLVRIQGRVCRVEGKMYGTAFLVADDLVLTNYHVVEAEAKGVAAPADLAFRFDYSTRDGADQPGRVVKAAAQWLVASAPYAQADLTAGAGAAGPGDLDFALVRLAEPVGRDAKGTGLRGSIPLSVEAPRASEGDVVFIVQHPQGAPLSLASGVVEAPVPSGLRLRYDANTEPGSSGSPVFDASLGLLALHHAGDPNWTPTYNQGIPIGLVAAWLKDRAIALAGAA
ncbi:trypsin-like peptidase domain-containing protein [Labrys wisconsinensis]|uniref:S1-C subfamily serine protease n=1 Tax=Labrys wisconsinensis TaxID=425677 RepID=A0ABU0JJ56_9HYPH|nr:trypsin-like peptidase domain-containing protein [Labrys wisconsinensis]MDQ0473443.1 S1-C subfamily serine protease [Labrys wisconsinensis]